MKRVNRDINGMTDTQVLMLNGIANALQRKANADKMNMTITAFNSQMKLIYIIAKVAGIIALTDWARKKKY